jgi:hypothetical protein
VGPEEIVDLILTAETQRRGEGKMEIIRNSRNQEKPIEPLMAPIARMKVERIEPQKNL